MIVVNMENARTIVGACVSLAGLLKKIVQVGLLNTILTGGGHLGPGQPKTPWHVPCLQNS